MSHPTRPGRILPTLADRSQLDIPISALHLEETGRPEPWHRLHGSLSIGGCAFDVDAIAVEWSPHAYRGHVPAAAGLREYFDGVIQALRTEFPFCEISLVEIGRAHV